MSKLTTFIAITFLIFIVSCSSEDMVKIRKEVWIKQIHHLNLTGNTFEELIVSVKSLGVTSEPFYDEKEFSVVLETIESSSLVCGEWYILLSAKTGDKQKISEYKVSSAGHCL